MGKDDSAKHSLVGQSAIKQILAGKRAWRINWRPEGRNRAAARHMYNIRPSQETEIVRI